MAQTLTTDPASRFWLRLTEISKTPHERRHVRRDLFKIVRPHRKHPVLIWLIRDSTVSTSCWINPIRLQPSNKPGTSGVVVVGGKHSFSLWCRRCPSLAWTGKIMLESTMLALQSPG